VTAAALTSVIMSDDTSEGRELTAEEREELERKKLDELRLQITALKIKEERTIKKMNQDEVASAAGLKRWNVSDVEQNRSMSLPTLWRICDALDISLGVILARVDRAIKDREEERRLGLVRSDDT